MSNPLPTILVVDDSGTTRAMIKRVIGMTGLSIGSIHEAADGQAGLEVMKLTHVHLVLADLNMPVMDGIEMIRRMREDEKLRHIPVVVISAQPDERLIAQLKRDGVLGYIAKPFTAEAVRDIIQPALLSPVPPAQTLHQPEPDLAAALNGVLPTALAEALETMAFITPEPASERNRPEPSSGVRLVRIEFHDKLHRGSLALAVPSQFCSYLASNCAGGDEAAAEDAADDALKELANVACGVLLRKRVKGSAGFEMAPAILEVPTDLQPYFTGNDTVSLIADGFPVTAHVTIGCPQGASHGR